MWRGAISLLWFATIAVAAPTTTQSSTQSTTQATANILVAIKRIFHEFDVSPRAKPDFFKEHAPPSTGAITAALSAAIANDPRRDAYVRWQLLGALPEKVDEELAARLIPTLRALQPLVPRPGIELRDQQQLDRLLQRANRDEGPIIQENLKTQADKTADRNTFSLLYRDELYRRLPVSYDALEAGFTDARQRCTAGIDPKAQIKQLSGDVRTWAATDATAQQLAAMARFLTELSQTPSTEYYDAVEWSTTGGSGHLRWKKKKLNLNDRKQLDDLIEFVRQQAKTKSN